uniref:BTB domain-containing protein n=1 Tax=Ditylenchus dipsaci TaxID=166011 RepID=A0A915CUF4_9BILA
MHQDSDSETDESGSAKGSTDSYFNSGAQIDFESSSATQNSSKTVRYNGRKEESCFTDSDDDDGEALLTVRGIESIAKDSRDQAPLPQLHLIPKRTHSTVSRINDDTDQWGADDLAAQTEYTLSLTDTKLKDALMSRVNTFRRNRELCDVVLFVKEHEILAHKLVLASISPALLTCF